MPKWTGTETSLAIGRDVSVLNSGWGRVSTGRGWVKNCSSSTSVAKGYQT